MAARERPGLPGPIILSTASFPKPACLPWIRWSPWPRNWAPISSRFNIPFSIPPPTFSATTVALSPEFAAEQGLDLAPPSIPEGEYYESEITAADLPLYAGQAPESPAPGPGPAEAGLFAEPAAPTSWGPITWTWPMPSPRCATPPGRAAAFCPTAPCRPACTWWPATSPPNHLPKSGTAPRCAASGRSSPAGSSPDAPAAAAGALPECSRFALPSPFWLTPPGRPLFRFSLRSLFAPGEDQGHRPLKECTMFDWQHVTWELTRLLIAAGVGRGHRL